MLRQRIAWPVLLRRVFATVGGGMRTRAVSGDDVTAGRQTQRGRLGAASCKFRFEGGKEEWNGKKKGNPTVSLGLGVGDAMGFCDEASSGGWRMADGPALL